MAWRRKKIENNSRSPRDQSQSHAPVFSYYSKRTQPSTDTFNRQGNRPRSAIHSIDMSTARWWIRYLPSILSLAIVLTAVMYTTTLSTKPKLNIANVSKNSAILMRETDEYEDVAQKLFEQSMFNQSKLTLNSDKLAQDLEQRFPELGEVVVTVPLFGRKPIIEVRPARPSLLLAAKNGVYVIDTNGTAVLRASELISSVRDQLPVINDNNNTTVELGKQILPIDMVKFIAALGYQFSEKEIRTEAYSLPAIVNEVHVKPTGESYIIKFNTELDPRIQTGGFFALKQQLAGEGKQISEYIDVRVEGRVFYK